MSVQVNIGTTVVKLINGTWKTQGVTTTALRKYHANSPDQLISQFNESQEDLQKATVGSRDAAAQKTLYVAVPFTDGTKVRLPHLLGSANVGVWLGVPRKSFGYCTWDISPDGTTVILSPSGSFVADVEIRVIP